MNEILDPRILTSFSYTFLIDYYKHMNDNDFFGFNFDIY